MIMRLHSTVDDETPLPLPKAERQPKLIASASPTQCVIDSTFLKEQCSPLNPTKKDMDEFAQSVDAVTGEGAAVHDRISNQ